MTLTRHFSFTYRINQTKIILLNILFFSYVNTWESYTVVLILYMSLINQSKLGFQILLVNLYTQKTSIQEGSYSNFDPYLKNIEGL